MNILGISAFYHDSAAALVQDGNILAAAQEERFTRIKHDQDFPVNAVDYCLTQAGISADQLDYVVFYDQPWSCSYLTLTAFNFASRALASINSGKSSSAYFQMFNNFSYWVIAFSDQPFCSYNIANL